ncbi:juvenile hormone acid O-methyltransferase-like [Lineus longissimus]|uniref:juvenile hormone acid O-methyltransferase-like n=1 Tax=Lineus longissimus TaxID=88925 RepID=UPI002B4DF95F
MNPDPYVYSRYNLGSRKWARETLDGFIPRCDRPRNILDVGCGTGEVTHLLAERFPKAKVVAVDKLPSMVQYAKDQNSTDRIDFFVMDIQNNELTQDSWRNNFDFVFSFLCMQWVEDQLAALRNIYSLTRPGGEALIVLGVKPSAAFLRLMKELKEHPRWKHYLENFSAMQWNTSKNGLIRWRIPDPVSGYSNVVKDAGFTILSAKTKEYEYVPDSDDRCRGMLEILLPHVRAIPEDNRQEFMDDVLELYMTFCPKTVDKRTIWTPTLLLVHCVKEMETAAMNNDRKEEQPSTSQSKRKTFFLNFGPTCMNCCRGFDC